MRGFRLITQGADVRKHCLALLENVTCISHILPLIIAAKNQSHGYFNMACTGKVGMVLLLYYFIIIFFLETISNYISRLFQDRKLVKSLQN